MQPDLLERARSAVTMHAWPPEPVAITPALLSKMKETQRSPCPKCGARTERQAERMCRPSQDETGDYSCPTDFTATDKQGWFLGPTKAAEAASSVYWGEMCRRQEAEYLLEEWEWTMDRRMKHPGWRCGGGEEDRWDRLPGVVAFNNSLEASHG